MKVLAVDQDAIFASDRGLWRALSERTDAEIFLLVPAHWRVNGQLINCEPEGSNLHVRPCEAVLAGRSHRAFYPELMRLVREESPDILYVNAEPESFLALQGAHIKSTSGNKLKYILMSWRNIDFKPGGFPYRLARLHDWAEKYSLQKADGCIARNADAASILRKKGFENSVVIPPSVDRSVFFPRTDDERRGEDSDNSWSVGYIGRIDSQKGIDILLTAVSYLARDISIRITGNGPAKDNLQIQARSLGISDRVRWESAVPHSEVRDRLVRAKALVLPSRTGTFWKEQFGRVLIESMACGVPVIGSDSGEIPNVIGDAGIVVPEGDPQALAAAIKRLCDDEPLRSELIAKGQARVDRRFSIDAVLPLYQNLLVQGTAESLPG
jgi:glycosyltransferase involved in cell wall biosynthesis